MKKTFAFTMASLLATLSLFAGPQRVAYTFATDHTNALYTCGETATFTVTVRAEKGGPLLPGKIRATLDNSGPKTFLMEEWDLAKTNVFTVSGKLDEPGFLRLMVRAGDPPLRSYSVGYEPEKIRKGSPSPADFDDFWRNAKAKLAREVPPDARLEKNAAMSTEKYDCYNISFATFGRRIYGFMSVPTDKSKAPYPVDIEVNAAGMGDWTNAIDAHENAICVRFSVFDFPPDWRWQELKYPAKLEALNAEFKRRYGVSEYPSAGISVSREAYFFYPVILGIDRAVDWIAARPDVDAKHIRYFGTSQGGGMGLVLTGLNPHFCAAALFVPAMTDTMGLIQGRRSGWPQPIESQLPENRAAAAVNAPYFDGANFASRIRCPIRIVVGFSDTTCPPSNVYATYNEIRVKDKEIIHGLGMSHDCFWPLHCKYVDWVRSR